MVTAVSSHSKSSEPRSCWKDRTIALVALGPEEARVARYVLPFFSSASLHVHGSVQQLSDVSPAEPYAEIGPEEQPFAKIAERIQQLFDQVQGLIVFAPIGVVVRSLAPLLRSKLSDPAVVVVDACGRYAVSLLSGHEGGANDLSLYVADLLQAEPVVTTTTEAKKKYVIGVGCRRGTARDDIIAAIRQAIAQIPIGIDQVRWLATAEIKRDEAGLVDAASSLGIPLRFVSLQNLRRWALTESAQARRTFDIPAVAEPAAMFVGTRTRCLMPRTVFPPGITIAIAEEALPWSGSAQVIPTIERTAPSEPFDEPT